MPYSSVGMVNMLSDIRLVLFNLSHISNTAIFGHSPFPQASNHGEIMEEKGITDVSMAMRKYETPNTIKMRECIYFGWVWRDSKIEKPSSAASSMYPTQKYAAT